MGSARAQSMIDGQGAAAAVFLDSELLMLLAARARMTGELVDHLPPLDEQPLAEAGANDRGHDQFVRVITAERGHGDHGGPLSQRPIIKQRDGVLHRLDRTPYAQ